MHKEGRLDSRDQCQRLVTKSKFDNLYGCRIAGRRYQEGDRRDDRGQGRRGRGLRTSARFRAGAPALSAQVWITEIDPICALQASMEGYRVVTMDYACDKADIFVTGPATST